MQHKLGLSKTVPPARIRAAHRALVAPVCATRQDGGLRDDGVNPLFSSPITTCLWPGLARLWFRGEWTGLAAATLFAAALNVMLVSSFLWPELLPSAFGWIGWPVVLVVWFASALRTIRVLPELRHPARRADLGLFIQAQDEYLKGHWFEAESLLQQATSHCQHDASAQLLLATLYRRTRRRDEAERRLRLLERLDGAGYWACEIQRERALLTRGADTVEPASLEKGSHSPAAPPSGASDSMEQRAPDPVAAQPSEQMPTPDHSRTPGQAEDQNE